MNGRKALIVDDSRLAQFVLKKMLTDQNMLVDTSPSAEDALDYLKNNKPDVIFLDHTMPGMNGLEVLKVIKANPETAPIPVMMYTSQEDSSYMSQAREMGALAVLPKQLKQDELVEALTTLNLHNDTTDGASATSDKEDKQVKRNTFEENKEELEKLVYNAEIALGHESAQQKLQLKLEQQREYFERHIENLHDRIEALMPAAEKDSSQGMNFWNNVFWATIYCVTVVIFTTLYFQQKNAIQQLSQNQNQLASTAGTVASLSSQANTNSRSILDQVNRSAATTTTPNSNGNIQQELSALEKILNTNNQIPFDELLLGDTVQSSLEELIPSLRAMNFSGRVTIVAHDGNFCVTTNEGGQFELADDETPVSECDITEPSTRLADIASIGLLQSITANNQASDSDFVITLNPAGTNLPVEQYPSERENTLASNWNDTARKNRRVEIKLFPQ